MLARILASLCALLYAASLGMPAVDLTNGGDPVWGWQCLVYGPATVFWPYTLIAWSANVALVVVLVRALLGRRTDGPFAALPALLGILGVAVLILGLKVAMLPGAVVWGASLALGGLAASLVDDRRTRSFESAYFEAQERPVERTRTGEFGPPPAN